MTQKEQISWMAQTVGELKGIIEAKHQSDLEYKESVKNYFLDQNKKIDDLTDYVKKGHNLQQEQLDKHDSEIYNDVDGLRTRTKSLESTRNNVKKGITWAASAGGLGTLLKTQWENISELFKNL